MATDVLTAATGRSRLHHAYRAVLAAGFLWAAFNTFYVYIFLGGSRTYRIESAMWVLVALLVPLLLTREEGRASFPDLSTRERRGLLALACASWLAIMLPQTRFPFLNDDYVFVARYEHWRDLVGGMQFFRPVFATIFWALRTVGGGSPIPFHLVGFLSHAGSATLVYALVRRFYEHPTPAVLAFCLFLLNPLQLEATLWVSGLQETLWVLFALSTVCCYVGAERLTGGRTVLAAALMAAALLSKETAVCLALLLPGADLLFFGARARQGRLRAYTAFALVLVAYLATRSAFASIEREFLESPTRFFAQRFLSTPYEVFAQPWNADVVRLPGIAFAAIGLTLLCLLFARVARNRGSRRLLIGPAVILISTLPLYSYFFVGPNLLAARYVYLAAAGWAVLLAEMMSVVRHRGYLIVAIAGTTLLSAAFLHVNLQPWRSASAVISVTRDALTRGEPVVRALERWQAQSNTPLVIVSGTPAQVQGVMILSNGYPEFEKLFPGPPQKTGR